jgi:hypothetical protein
MSKQKRNPNPPRYDYCLSPLEKQQVDEMNETRALHNLSPLVIKHRKCLQCDKTFETYKNRVCGNCHRNEVAEASNCHQNKTSCE